MTQILLPITIIDIKDFVGQYFKLLNRNCDTKDIITIEAIDKKNKAKKICAHNILNPSNQE